MEDVKWLLKNYGFLIIMLLIIVVVSSIFFGKKVSEKNVEEEQNLQKEAMSAAERCMEIYKDSSISNPQTNYSRIENFSDEQRKNVVKSKGK